MFKVISPCHQEGGARLFQDEAQRVALPRAQVPDMPSLIGRQSKSLIHFILLRQPHYSAIPLRARYQGHLRSIHLRASVIATVYLPSEDVRPIHHT